MNAGPSGLEPQIPISGTEFDRELVYGRARAQRRELSCYLLLSQS